MTKNEQRAIALAWADGRRLDANGKNSPEPHAVFLAALLREAEAAIVSQAKKAADVRRKADSCLKIVAELIAWDDGDRCIDGDFISGKLVPMAHKLMESFARSHIK